MRNPYKTYEQLQDFSKSIDIDIKKLEKEMLKFNSREVFYDTFNDLVVLRLPDNNCIYIKRMELL